jgi:hypothetical protein
MHFQIMCWCLHFRVSGLVSRLALFFQSSDSLCRTATNGDAWSACRIVISQNLHQQNETTNDTNYSWITTENNWPKRDALSRCRCFQHLRLICSKKCLRQVTSTLLKLKKTRKCSARQSWILGVFVRLIQPFGTAELRRDYHKPTRHARFDLLDFRIRNITADDSNPCVKQIGNILCESHLNVLTSTIYLAVITSKVAHEFAVSSTTFWWRLSSLSRSLSLEANRHDVGIRLHDCSCFYHPSSSQKLARRSPQRQQI